MSTRSLAVIDGSRSPTRRDRAKGFTARLRRLIPTRDEARKNWALRWLGPLLEREWLWHVNHRAVAMGAALGVFFGLIIPVGQMPLAAAGTILMRANLPAAAFGTLVSNPFTVGPIYWLAYKTGAAILPAAEPAQNVVELTGVGVSGSRLPFEWLDTIASRGAPLMLGLALFAVGGALLTYFLVSIAWRFSVQRRRRHQRVIGA